MKQNGLRLWSLLLVLALVLGIAPAAAAQTIAAKAEPKLKFEEKTYTVLDGFTLTLAMKQPEGSDLPEDIEFTIPKAQRKYATVDKQTGVVTGLLKGKVTVTAHSPSLGKKSNATCTVKVKANAYTWKMQTSGKNLGARLSPKRIYRHAGKTMVEYYLYNKAYSPGIKRLYVNSGSMAIWVYDTSYGGGGAFVDYVDLGASYKFSSKFYRGKYGVVKGELKNVSPDLDFTTGRYVMKFVPDGQYVGNKDGGGAQLMFDAK